MKCNYKKQFFIVLLFVFVTSTFGRRGGGGSRSGGSRTGGGRSGGGIGRFFGFGGSKSTSHSTSHTGTSHTGTSHSYPKQTYSNGNGYGWRSSTGAGNTGHGHYYNSPSSPTNFGSSHISPSYHTQNTYGSFQPVSSGIAPSYHFHRSTSYVPIYIPSSHTYVHRHYHDRSTSSSSQTPPPPPSEPVVYEQKSSDGNSETPTMVVGFNNMIVYGVFQKDKHYVITVSEDLDEDMDDIPDEFLRTKESSLFEIVTLKPRTTTSEAPEVPEAPEDEWTTESSTRLKAFKILTASNKTAHNQDGIQTFGANGVTDDVLNLNFGDMIP